MLHAWIKSDPVNPKAGLDDALKGIMKITHDSKSKIYNVILYMMSQSVSCYIAMHDDSLLSFC